MSTSNTNASAQAFPDIDFDNLPELPSFKVPADGHYKLLLTISAKTIASKPAIEFAYEVVEIMEQADPTAAPATVGDKFSVAYFTDNEFGMGKLKKAVVPLVEFFNTKSISAIAEQSQGLSVFGTVKGRKDKNDAEKVYADVTNIVVE